MLDFLKRAFGALRDEEYGLMFIIDETTILFALRLVENNILKEKTRAAEILRLPYSVQYISGTMLNVLCFDFELNLFKGQFSHISGKLLSSIFTERHGQGSADGYKQVGEMAREFRAKGAPLGPIPWVGQELVAEFCIQNVIFQNQIPDDEFEIFRKIYFEEVDKLRNYIITSAQ